MSAVAAGGGLLIAAAGAAPAYASAPAAAPHGAHKITLTAHPRAGIGPHTILPCAEKPGAAIKPATCNPPTITCVIDAPAPGVLNEMVAGAGVHCDHPVTDINMSESMFLNNSQILDEDGSEVEGEADTSTAVATPVCQAGTYTNAASAFITFPPGYVVTGGSNPIHASTDHVMSSSFCPRPPGGGGGGGGGCAIHAPSLAGHPAARHPHLIVCS